MTDPDDELGAELREALPCQDIYLRKGLKSVWKPLQRSENYEPLDWEKLKQKEAISEGNRNASLMGITGNRDSPFGIGSSSTNAFNNGTTSNNMQNIFAPEPTNTSQSIFDRNHNSASSGSMANIFGSGVSQNSNSTGNRLLNLGV